MDDNEFLLLDREQKIKQIIGKYGVDKFYVSYSGGKDSTVMSHLIDLAIPGNEIPRVFADTGIEMNLIREFVRKKAESDKRIEMIKPSVSIRKMLETDGYPFKSKEHSYYLDMYQRNGIDNKTVQRYLNPDESRKRFGCPTNLRFQFSPEYKLKVSDKCCFRMKEEPIKNWEREHGKSIAIVGIRQQEGGRRNRATCLAFDKDKLKQFHPLAVVSEAWEEWFITKFQVKLCSLYYPPYNLKRTGCKGCPFNPFIQRDLDMLERYFPSERRQCEIIWKPVYKEYRKIGYRLNKNQNAEQIEMHFDEEGNFIGGNYGRNQD